ncbi:class I SAM-dependent methyltransferase [Oceanicaulis alexandrii]|uniref:class I SAM-dependent methyltransferase n=1 Tax=Oceanicaulis alexandrii TaxID=153233 RepID=UPI00235670D6|nr:SAM-dependent methyltransferase [Oceanicaulis alexandrii]
MSDNDFRPAQMIKERLQDRLRSEGSLSVAAYMAEALFHPMAGFYATKDPLGAANDFITAPEISQMFGELLGLWAAECWMQMGAPSRFELIELGPGTGRMMSDMLRAGRAAPGFLDAVHVTLVEASPALKMVQGQTLANAPVPVHWAKDFEKTPSGPAVVIGNEFLDCLPIRQAVRHQGQWRERVVTLHPEDQDRFVFGLGPMLSDSDIGYIAPALRKSEDGALVELRPGDQQQMEQLANRFKRDPSYALFVDYGSSKPETGDTLQAIRAHQKVDPLDAPGTADLTAWVDFDRLLRLGLDAGLAAFGPMTQGEFLTELGIEQRAAVLSKSVDESGQARLKRQMHRLVSPEDMGELFKLAAFSSDGLPPAPGIAPFSR